MEYSEGAERPTGATLTQQLVRPAVERLAGCCVLVLLVVLDWPEVSQSSHEAPEVHLVLSGRHKTVNKNHRAGHQTVRRRSRRNPISLRGLFKRSNTGKRPLFKLHPSAIKTTLKNAQKCQTNTWNEQTGRQS